MSILKSLNDLITEHGSSTILRERIGLFQQQFSMLESENIELKKKNKILESEKVVLKFEINALALKLHDAQAEIESLKSQKTPTPNWGSQPRIKGRMEL